MVSTLATIVSSWSWSASSCADDEHSDMESRVGCAQREVMQLHKVGQMTCVIESLCCADAHEMELRVLAL